MTCVELQESLIENDSGGTAAQRAHLKDCPHCAGLVADLLVIACAAGDLRAAHEPGPHVWNSIETTLRREGIIRPHSRAVPCCHLFDRLMGLGQLGAPRRGHRADHCRDSRASACSLAGTPCRRCRFSASLIDTASDASIAGLNDNDLLAELAEQAPALQGAIHREFAQCERLHSRRESTVSTRIPTTRKHAEL